MIWQLTTHVLAYFVGLGMGLLVARWAIKPEPNPDRFWREQ